MSFNHLFFKLDIIDKKLDFILKEIREMNAVVSTDIPSAIAELQAAVANETTIDQSAVTLINGIPALIAAAVQAAQAAGATPAQLAAFDTLAKSISANATGLSASVTANTPAASSSAKSPAGA